MSLGRDILLLLALVYSVNATCTETDWPDWPDCCEANSDDPSNPIIHEIVYRKRTSCLTIAGEEIEDTKYDSQSCPDQYGAWGVWEECKTVDDCSGANLGFWQRSREVCGTFTDLKFTDTEKLECATGYKGTNCGDCSDGFYKNDNSECVACDCDTEGTKTETCTGDVRACICLANYDGDTCNSCSATAFENADGICEACDCSSPGSDPTNAGACTGATGTCACLGGYVMDKCDTCDVNYYLKDDGSCSDCGCNSVGSNGDECADITGTCECNAGHMGDKCETCATDYYSSDPTSIACIACTCSSPGTIDNCNSFDGSCICDTANGYEGDTCSECSGGWWLDGAECTACGCNTPGSVGETCAAGICECKEGYQGDKCDTCDVNYYLEDGGSCSDCGCNSVGSNGDECEDITGICTCKQGYAGPKCEICDSANGYEGDLCNECSDEWYLDAGACTLCNCDSTGADGSPCDSTTGACTCNEGYTTRDCSQCEDDYYHDSVGVCTICDCNTFGTVGTGCTDTTGKCTCDAGYMGDKCDECATDYYESAEKVCSVCPAGWFYYEGACYKVSGAKKTFDDAKAACTAEATPSKLFEPKSEAENQAIFDIMKEIFGADTEYFVGIVFDATTDTGTMKYVSDDMEVDLEVFPNMDARAGVDHCIAIDVQNDALFWTDRYCSDRYTFVCQTKPVASSTPPAPKGKD